MGAQHEGHGGHAHGGHAHGGHAGAHGTLGGLSVSAGGYTLRAMPTVFEAGREETFGVRILDRTGREVHNLDEQHEKHLRPSLDEDGSWSVPLTLPEPGVYRAFVDFSLDGVPLTLGVDLTAPGDLRIEPLPDPTNAVSTEDGYEVALEAETPTPETGSSLIFHIERS